MLRNLKGALAAAMLLGGGAVLAQGAQEPMQGSQPQSGQHQMGSQSQMQTKSEVTGKVIKAERTELVVRNEQGESIPLKIEKDTKFKDPKVKSIRDLKPGQEVRASYKLKGTDNVATQVWVEHGKGGSGQEGMENQQREPLYPEDKSTEPGTGGSGTMGAPDAGSATPGTGGSGSLDEPKPINQPTPGDVNQPVDMHQGQ